MILDPETTRIVATLVLVGPTAIFAAGTAQRHNDPASRMWSVGFLATTAGLAVSAVLDATPSDPVLLAAVAVMPVFGLAAVWMGTRLLNRRSAGWPATLAAIVVVAAFTASTPGLARGAQLLVAATIGVVTILELGTGGSRAYVEARFLRVVVVVLVLVSISAVIRQSVDSVPGAAPSDWRVLGVAAMFAVTMMVALNALREGEVERSMGARVGRVMVAGLLNPADFRTRATDQIGRAALTGQDVELVIVTVRDLDSLVHAYGQQVREAAIRHVADVLRRELSADRLLGYVGRGRFAVLLVDPSAVTSASDRIRHALATTPAPAGLPLRTDCDVTVLGPPVGVVDLDDLVARDER